MERITKKDINLALEKLRKETGKDYGFYSESGGHALVIYNDESGIDHVISDRLNTKQMYSQIWCCLRMLWASN